MGAKISALFETSSHPHSHSRLTDDGAPARCIMPKKYTPRGAARVSHRRHQQNVRCQAGELKTHGGFVAAAAAVSEQACV